MKRYLTFIGVCIALMVVAGCTNGAVGPDTTPFVGGKNGLLLSFAPSAPPREVFDNGQFPFSVIVSIDNVGEHSIQAGDGYIQLDGISPIEYGVTQSDLRRPIPAIEGSRKSSDGRVITGSRDVVEFTNLNYQNRIFGTLTSVIRAQACYDYQTRATANLCIKRDTIDSLRTNEICSIAGDKVVHNSGAPIHVKSVRSSPQGRNSIQVQFTIGSVGSAKDSFYKEGTECDDRHNNPERYKVFVEIEPLVGGQIPARCSGLDNGDSGYIILFSGEDRIISCTFDTAGVTTDFETRANINLRYRYSQYIEVPLIVRHVSVE